MGAGAPKVAVGSCTAAAFVVVPGVAGAVKSWQGSDFSVDHNSYRQITTCDEESDGRGVHSDAKLENDTTVGRASVDTDGPGNSCGTSIFFSLNIIQHRTCEEIFLWPDICGFWQGTGAPPS